MKTIICPSCDNTYQMGNSVRVNSNDRNISHVYYCRRCAGEQIADDRATKNILRQQIKEANAMVDRLVEFHR